MTAKVGQAVQYFDSRGYGPFAAIVLATTEAAPADPEAGTEATPAGVTLEYTKVGKYGSVTRAVRTGIPAEDSPEHAAAAAAITEGDEVCGVPKKARYFRDIA